MSYGRAYAVEHIPLDSEWGRGRGEIHRALGPVEAPAKPREETCFNGGRGTMNLAPTTSLHGYLHTANTLMAG